jgi:hypothetical protein
MRILCREELQSTDRGLTLGRFLVQDPLSKSIKGKFQQELESSILFIKNAVVQVDYSNSFIYRRPTLYPLEIAVDFLKSL